MARRGDTGFNTLEEDSSRSKETRLLRSTARMEQPRWLPAEATLPLDPG